MKINITNEMPLGIAEITSELVVVVVDEISSITEAVIPEIAKLFRHHRLTTSLILTFQKRIHSKR
jgi:hypothetical protein